MKRARLAAAHVLLWAARFLAGGATPPEEPEEEDAGEDDEDFPMPAGHPVVVRSERANEMIVEGMRAARPTAKKSEPDAPLAGSLRDRMNRRDL